MTYITDLCNNVNSKTFHACKSKFMSCGNVTSCKNITSQRNSTSCIVEICMSYLVKIFNFMANIGILYLKCLELPHVSMGRNKVICSLTS